jgi:lysophospholipase L1-like esterase
MAWSGTGLVAVVNGSKISVQLQTEGGSPAFFHPVVDGRTGTRFQVASGAAQTVVLGNNLAAGDHAVELYRDTEGMYGDSVFLGFVDGVVKGAPAASGRLLEVVGDSISAGYGNLGMEVHPPWDNTCSFTFDTEAAYQSYAWMLGRTLGAEVSIIARSGWGMYRDNTGATSGVLSSVYGDTLGTQTSPAWDFHRQPQGVLINLGTNDGATGDPGKPYEDAYVAFLKTVRSHYPNAWIFLTLGPMTSDPLLTMMRGHLTAVVAAAGDPKVVTIDLATQDTTMTGCDYHPNVAEDQVMATALAPAIKAKLGW